MKQRGVEIGGRRESGIEKSAAKTSVAGGGGVAKKKAWRRRLELGESVGENEMAIEEEEKPKKKNGTTKLVLSARRIMNFCRTEETGGG